MTIGREQRYHPGYTRPERLYISLFGVPVAGLRIRARNIMSLLPADLRPSMVLDAGSGPGVITFLLARRFPKARVTGVDVNEEELKACRVIAGRAGFTNTDFVQADISGLPWQGRFDLIVCVDILEHIKDDARALTGLYKALKPGGTLLLHVPSLYRRYPFLRQRLNFDVPTHVRPGYRPGEIQAKVRGSGFAVRDTGFTYGVLETVANNISYMITRARKRNKLLYALAFPPLNLLSWLGACARPSRLGAGIYILADRQRRE